MCETGAGHKKDTDFISSEIVNFLDPVKKQSDCSRAATKERRKSGYCMMSALKICEQRKKNPKKYKAFYK